MQEGVIISAKVSSVRLFVCLSVSSVIKISKDMTDPYDFFYCRSTVY